ncbi:MAG: serine/threonine-protein kinase [Sandaracinaceae bacterium]
MTSGGQGERGMSVELASGELLAGRYRIEGRLGTGGIGIVYRASQLPLERPVAIKVLHDDLLTYDELRARFEREARVLSALTHPHVVSISDYGIEGDRPFLVMELLEGQTLEEVVREDPIDPHRAIDLIRQVLKGLASAHEKQISHRDLKPANVFLTRLPDGSEHVKLLDFGLARMVTREDVESEVTLTQRGVVFGTPAYMSPEQAAGGSVDVASDVYSTGVLLFELLAGRRPYLGDTRADLLRAHLTAPVPRIGAIRSELRMHDALTDLIETAMAKDPHERYRDASEMLVALDAIPAPPAWLSDRSDVSEAPTQMSLKALNLPSPKRSRSGGWWALGLLTLAAGVGTWMALGIDDPEPAPAAAHAETMPVSSPTVASGPRDPFAPPVPEPLQPFLDMVDRGYVFRDRAEVGDLYRLAREMPDDPRPLLLLGHLMVARGWYTEGMRRYERAVNIDRSVRGDPRLLDTLLVLATRESVGERAADLVAEIYGSEALGDVNEAIDEHAGQSIPQLRLVRLRDRLTGH